MAKHSKNEFRALCGGIKRQYLNTYINRKKIVIGNDGLIDDQIYENNIFVLNQQEKNGGPISMSELDKIDGTKKSKNKIKPVTPEPVEPREEVKAYEEPKPPPPKPVRKAAAEPIYESGNISQMDREKKQIDLQRAKEELEIKILQKQKLMGEVIPVDLVIGVFTRHFKNVTELYHKSADTMLTEIGHQFKADREQLGHFRKRLIDLINEVTKESMEVSKAEIGSIQDEFSQSRGRGEKKL